VAHAAAWIARQAELALLAHDLSLPQYRILHLLEEGTSLPSSLALQLDVRRPSVTAVVDGLVARRLVVRTPDPTDRRKITHAITEEGSSLLAEADRAIEERLFEVADALGDRAASDAAIAGLTLWGPALLAWHEQRHEKTKASREGGPGSEGQSR
jgi:long-chain acyl-CoA synthetase